MGQALYLGMLGRGVDTPELGQVWPRARAGTANSRPAHLSSLILVAGKEEIRGLLIGVVVELREWLRLRGMLN